MCVRFELLSRATLPSQSRDKLRLGSAVFVPCSHPFHLFPFPSDVGSGSTGSPTRPQALSWIRGCAEGGNPSPLQISP